MPRHTVASRWDVTGRLDYRARGLAHVRVCQPVESSCLLENSARVCRIRRSRGPLQSGKTCASMTGAGGPSCGDALRGTGPVRSREEVVDSGSSKALYGAPRPVPPMPLPALTRRRPRDWGGINSAVACRPLAQRRAIGAILFGLCLVASVLARERLATEARSCGALFGCPVARCAASLFEAVLFYFAPLYDHLGCGGR